MAEVQVGMKEPFAAALECPEWLQQRGLNPWCQITALPLDRMEYCRAGSLTRCLGGGDVPAAASLSVCSTVGNVRCCGFLLVSLEFGDSL